MALVFRPAKKEDLAACYEMSAAWNRHAFDEDVWNALPEIWRELLANKEMIMAVWEDDALPKGARLKGFGSSVFPANAFAAELLNNPRPYITNRVCRSILEEKSLLLDYKGIRAANSADGVNVMTFMVASDTPPADDSWGAHAARIAPESFASCIAGYRLRCLLQENFGERFRQFLESAGWRSQYYSDMPATQQGTGDGERQPFLAWVTREEALARTGTAVARLFWFPPPRFYFTPIEQEVLCLALRDFIDEAMAEDLEISLNTLKKHWHDIFQRIQDIDSNFFSQNNDESEQDRRGVEKRRPLLAYLRQHPEELRPHLKPSRGGK